MLIHIIEGGKLPKPVVDQRYGHRHRRTEHINIIGKHFQRRPAKKKRYKDEYRAHIADVYGQIPKFDIAEGIYFEILDHDAQTDQQKRRIFCLLILSGKYDVQKDKQRYRRQYPYKLIQRTCPQIPLAVPEQGGKYAVRQHHRAERNEIAEQRRIFPAHRPLERTRQQQYGDGKHNGERCFRKF